METCAVRWSLWRNGVVALIGLAFSVLSIPIILSSAKEPHTSLAGGIFFGFIGLWFGYRTLYRKPILVVDKHGISLPRYGLVPWDDIDKVGVMSGQLFVIFPRRPEAWRSRLPALYKLRQVLPKSKYQDWDSTIPLSLQNVDTPILAIFNIIKMYLPYESSGRGLLLFSRGDSVTLPS